MLKSFFFIVVSLSFKVVFAQTLTQRLEKAFAGFESDPSLEHATTSLYVINAKTGDVVFERNSQVGMAPASTQKIITSATAFALLGKDFRYRTEIGTCQIGKQAAFYIKPSGDPTFGSWRWPSTSEESVLQSAVQALTSANVNPSMQFVIDTTGLSAQETPDGWIWQDIGNYYGAGSAALNWRENQFDLFLQSGNKVDDPVTVTGTVPQLYDYPLVSVARSAGRGTGDNAYIYIPTRDGKAVVRGTIPVDEKRFKISGAMIDPARQFTFTLADLLRAKSRWAVTPQLLWAGADRLSGEKIFYTNYSPKLDSIVFWFLRKSINLYGEALVKTIALSKKGNASTAGGIELVRDFWKDKGIDENELNLYDGSGLSPLNRVTTHAQVTILRYAKSRDWFGAYYDAMPEYNGMKMKSGTINDVKGYCGYQLSKDGNEYIFSFLVNNYSGKSSAIVQKMYKILDLLK